MRKNILLFSILLTLFFVGIKGVSASACEYSLADIAVYRVTNDNGTITVSRGRYNTVLDTDTKLIMTINDTFAQGSQNISWSVSDNAFAVDSPTNFTASTSSTSVESGYEGEQINYYKTCPMLRILFKEESSVYRIKNVVFTTESNSQLNSEAATLTSILTGTWPSDLKIGTVYQYDFANNSAYSAPKDQQGNNEQGSYCENHPDDAFCAGFNMFKKSKEESEYDKDFKFCSSKGVLTTFNVLHMLLTIARVCVPLILIIIGSIAFFKATISNDEKANAKAFKDLMISVIIGIIIFFIPTIVYAIVNMAKGDDASFKNCNVCFTGKGGNCQSLIDGAQSK